jgi:alkylated DNA repair protein (DNA oxidative demethylase)
MDLFASISDVRPSQEVVAEGAVLLRGFARAHEAELVAVLRDVIAEAPFRHMVTPGGFRMSVAMTNCGKAGWISYLTGWRGRSRDWKTVAADAGKLSRCCAACGRACRLR